MDCDRARLVLAARGQRTPTGGEAAELQAHLDGCASCHAIAHEQHSTIDVAIGETIAAGQDSHGIAGRADEPLARGESIGRFLVLELLGKGGMGVVYSAYDPDLDRKVAIKLLRAGTASEDNRARLLREAQAMARIKHPNVIAVHEVGTRDEHVYVAMELVDGGTLREWRWKAERSVREILDVFAQAGRGLAAAHGAGLVHRDFKPDNVLMSGDGGVLVTDFGLVTTLAAARAEEPIDVAPSAVPLSEDLTRTGAILGTPTYMAPEQFAGTSSARSDQFAFCVALYEALYGERPFPGASFVELQANVLAGNLNESPGANVPSWLRRVVMRGLAVDPEARYPSMAELVEALTRDPVRRRRRAIAAAAAAAVAVGIAAISVLGAGSGETCGGGAERTAPVWNPARRAAMAAAFAASKRPHAPASFDRSAAFLDDWMRAWEAGVVAACRATKVRGEQSETLLDRRMHCLTRRLDEARATIDALIAGGADAVDRAVEVTGALPALAPCADVAGLLAEVAPPETAAAAAQVAEIRTRLDEALGEQRLGRYAKALAIARPALELARAGTYAPAIGEALLAVGMIEHFLGDRASATTLEHALRVATEAGDGRVAVEAAAWLMAALIDHAGRLDAAELVASFAEATAARVHPPVEIEVHLQTSIGAVLIRRHRPEPARVHLDRALELAERRLGPDHPLTLSTLQQLSQLARSRGRFAEARGLLERVVASRKRVAGEDHPAYASALAGLGDVLRAEARLDDAQRAYERALEIRIAALGPEHPQVGATYNSMGSLHGERGDYATSLRYYERALAIRERAYGPDNVEVAAVVLNLGLALARRGDRSGARRHYERSLALYERVNGPDHPSVTAPLTNLGVLAFEDKQFADALAMHRRALRITERVYGPDHPDAVDSMINIASALRNQGKLDDAEDMTVRALRAAEKAYGADHTRTGVVLANLGALQAARGRHADALMSFRRGAAIFEARLGKDHPNLSFPLRNEGEVLIALDRAAEAVPVLERALAIRTAAKMPPGAVAEVRFSLARALAADPRERERARAEARAALDAYVQASSTADAAAVRDWLRTAR